MTNPADQPAPKVIQLTRQNLRQWPLPEPSEDGKEGRGRVLIIGGTTELPGVVVLAGQAALRAGAGKLRIATCRSLAQAVGIAVPESRVFGLPETAGGGIAASAAAELVERANEVDAVVIGPGTLEEAEMSQLVIDMLPKLERPIVVLDAAAMNCLSADPKAVQHLKGRVILTPHMGEMAHLLGRDKAEIARQPITIATEAANQYGAVIVLKGVETFIAAPNAPIYHNTHGTLGLATGGSGDTLAGIMGGLAARGATPQQAAVWAVYLHARAGERLAQRLGRVGFLAREIPDEVPALLAEFDQAILD